MESWRLPEIETPDGTRSPVVLKSEDEARAVLLGLDPGQRLGDHQVKEHAWLLVVSGSVQIGAGSDTVEAPAGTLAPVPGLSSRARSAGSGRSRRRSSSVASPKRSAEKKKGPAMVGAP